MTRVIKPLPITSAMLVSTTAVETYAEYNPATPYSLNTRCTLAATGRRYLCIQGPSTANAPATSPLWWSDDGPSNAWALFDSLISTQSEHAGSLSVVIKPGICNSLSLFNMEGHTLDITARDGLAGPVVYSRSVDLDGTIITDWYQYYFEPFVQKGEVVLTDLPPYSNIHITVTVSSGSTARIGHLSVGTFYELGDAQYGATVGIIDFSRKDTSALGVTTLVQRAFSKRISARLMLDNNQINKVQRVLSDLRANACAWVITDGESLQALNVFGFYRDFAVEVAYPTKSYCSLEIEGMS